MFSQSIIKKSHADAGAVVAVEGAVVAGSIVAGSIVAPFHEL
jgi:hypothetical protein